MAQIVETERTEADTVIARPRLSAPYNGSKLAGKIAVRLAITVPEQQRAAGKDRQTNHQVISAIGIERDHAHLVALAHQGLLATMINVFAAHLEQLIPSGTGRGGGTGRSGVRQCRRAPCLRILHNSWSRRAGSCVNSTFSG